MSTIRGRLVVSITVTLGAALFAFAAVLYLMQRGERFRDLDARIRFQGDLIAALLAEESRPDDTLSAPAGDLGRTAQVVGTVRSVIRSLRDYVIVISPSQELPYVSSGARGLAVEPLRSLIDLGRRPYAGRALGSADLASDAARIPVRYYVREVRAGGRPGALVVAAAPTVGVVLPPDRLVSTMLLAAMVVIGFSILIVYLLVDRTLEPVDAIVEEVEAITDGRSLHRRLMEPRIRDELARLTDTLNAMLARLERSFVSLRRFTADASHELKTPLTILRSGIERAITHPQAPPAVMEVLEETLVEVNRMAELVDSLLTLARADEGRAPLHLEHVELKEVLSEVSETASILGEQAHVAVSVAVPERSITIAVDQSRIRQLLMNLLTNAIKYTPEGGAVAIDWEQVDGNVVLNVRDTGVGIAPGDLPHIFDRFWRADQARRRSGGRPGVGLGLAISKWIAEAHGGTIAVQSRPGRGTTFTVTLPLGQA
jgi:signal transduction histidine kinase